MANTISYQDSAGRLHELELHAHTSSWKNNPGIYVFVGARSHDGLHKVFYVGQTDSFQNRLPFHERWHEATKLGACWVGAMLVRGQADRDRIEADMIQRLQPPLNKQLRR